MDPVDLLVFGPHPDDIEIGIGGTVARHAALRLPRRPVRPDRRGDGQQRHGRGASRRGRSGPRGARRVLARQPALARSPHRPGPDRTRAAPWSSCGRAVRARWRIPYWADRHPDHVDASRTLTDALFDSGLRRFDAAGDAWRPEWVCYYFINDSATPSFVVDVSAHYDTKRRALACHRSQFTTAAAQRRRHAPDQPDLQPAHRKPRRPVRRPRRVPVRRRLRRPRTGGQGHSVQDSDFSFQLLQLPA